MPHPSAALMLNCDGWSADPLVSARLRHLQLEPCLCALNVCAIKQGSSMIHCQFLDFRTVYPTAT
jgi:hypothetical protein